MKRSNLDGKSLETWRKAHGWDRGYLAERLWLDASAIHRYESGGPISVLFALALAAIEADLTPVGGWPEEHEKGGKTDADQ